MDALIIFSHGSLLCGSGEALEGHARRLREQGNWSLVDIGYLNYSEPSFSETVDKVVNLGATRVLILPYFLVPGYFVSVSLPETIETAQKKHPNVEFVIAEALGFDESLADALLESATGAKTSEHWREPLLRASSACKPSVTCPLYNTPACPKSPGKE